MGIFAVYQTLLTGRSHEAIRCELTIAAGVSTLDGSEDSLAEGYVQTR